VTRTYTQYWADEEVAPLVRAADDLERDAAERLPYVGLRNRDKMLARIENLQHAIELLTEPAIEQ
jgi:hypothetical protein